MKNASNSVPWTLAKNTMASAADGELCIRIELFRVRYLVLVLQDNNGS